jgi:hypothetical protein
MIDDDPAPRTPTRGIPHLDGEQVRALRRVDAKSHLVQRATEGFAPLPLDGLRRAKGMSLAAIAALARMSESEAARLEAADSLDNVPVAVLRRYVAALGGELEIVARFPDTGHLLGIGGACRAAGEAEE